MAREKKPPEPKEDIPAWFMTYSDVITLLMTFFILLLTFATTEPERFEKSAESAFSNGSATGTAGAKIDKGEKDSFINRLRVPAARIAMRGAEMPPIERESASETWGEGLRSLNEEESQQNELNSHHFDVPSAQLFDSSGSLTVGGKALCKHLSNQLQDLPFHAAVQFNNERHLENLTKMMEYLFQTEKTRPGQLAMTYIRNETLDVDNVRFLVKRYMPNAKR